MARVAFIGLGRMGIGMAGRLVEAGHELVVTNRTQSRAEPLMARGVRWAPTPKQAAEGAAAVITMLADDRASAAVWTGPDGVLAAELPEGALAIECSTLSADWVATLSDRASAAGLRYLDAPVTGLPDAAAAGTLTLLVGGDSATVTAAEPVLQALATEVIHFGPVGAGTAYKLIVNLMGAVQIAGVAEGLAMAGAAGLDLAQVADALSRSQAAAPQVVRNAARMVAGDHDQNVTFTVALRRKDADYGVQLARRDGVAVPLADVALANLDTLIAEGAGASNESRIIEVARRPLRPE